MRVLLVLSLLIAFVSIESTPPPVALAATPVSISAGYIHTRGLKSDGTLACRAGTTPGMPRRRLAPSPLQCVQAR
jgi:hypothetical protein